VVREAVSEPEAVATGSAWVRKVPSFAINHRFRGAAATRSLSLPVLIYSASPTFLSLQTLSATPRPIEAGRPLNAVGSEVHLALDAPQLSMQKKPWPFKMSFLLRAVFRDHRNSAARVVSNSAYPIAAAAKTPIALDPAKCPRTVAGSLVPPGTTEEIIPTQLQPTSTSLANGVGP
jgi:hypothetical protein